jgi:ferrous iron transport protein A
MEKIISHGTKPTQVYQPKAAPMDKGESQPPLPLRFVREGEWVRIVSLNGGKGFHDRLAGVGLRVGGFLSIIRNGMDGKLLLGHEGTRLFLGGGMAQKIQVVIVEGMNR